MKTNSETNKIACWIDETPVFANEMIGLLRKQGALPQLIRDWVLEKELAGISIEKELQQKEIDEFRSRTNLKDEDAYINYLQNNHLNEDLLIEMITRPHKIVRYREERWGAFTNSLYLQNKDRFDLVTYNKLESNNPDVMQEIYFRLKDNEESWDGLAQQFPDAPANATALQGPIPVANVEKPVLKILRESEPERVARPIRCGNKVIVVALKQFHPSVFDESIRIELLKREFDEWLALESNKMLKKIRFSK